ncbi:DUF2510 domain-containing protein [Mycobacterium sp. GA-2829]|uniref:DUF2510 domain-containing protein n=1 Tax=Mycobacterium sp. GA-2829 TaxID=1772283 RepID=UPI000B313B53|nr:DUF2510 domain-containing protein [Mycobacterium sp. GA-2829]
MAIENESVPSPGPGWFTDPWDPRQLRYFDGHQWTDGVAPTTPTAGFPIGEPVLVLRAIPCGRDVDVSCALETATGHQVGLIRPRGNRLSGIDREIADLGYEVVGATGAGVLFFTRLGGLARKHSIVVSDPAGRTLGRIRQTSSVWRQIRTPRLAVTLEAGDRELATTEICIDPRDRFAAVCQPIHSTAGPAIATVERRWRYAGTSNDFFDYTLTCTQPTGHPLPELLLATAFAHCLYDRLAVGGPLETYQSFGRGGTWHDAR